MGGWASPQNSPPNGTVLWAVLSLPVSGVTRGGGVVKCDLSAFALGVLFWVRFISETARR